MFIYQNIGYDIDYYEACYSLLNVLILIYNKMYDSRCLNETMYNHFEKIDKSIMDVIVDPISSDLSELAEELLNDQFDDLMNVLSFDEGGAHPSVEPFFKKISQKM